MNDPLHLPRPSAAHRTWFVAAGLALALLAFATGCTSPRYRSAPKETPPPVLVNLPSTEPPIEALVHTVIIFQGPGSWKSEAYWDEYVVTIANRGNALIRVDQAWLADFQGNPSAAGKDPWELETTSRTLSEQGFGFARNTAVQIGGGVGVLALSGGVGAMVFSGGWVTAGAGAAMGGILMLPAVIGGSIYKNISNRHAIEREFDRRRLVLPTVLVPGQLVQGSLFFRISPGPQRLTLQCRIDDEERNIIVDLKPLAGLHLKTPPQPAKAEERGSGTQ